MTSRLAPRPLSELSPEQKEQRPTGRRLRYERIKRARPPQLDEFFCANEAHLRAAELAEIGLSESTIWDSAPR